MSCKCRGVCTRACGHMYVRRFLYHDKKTFVNLIWLDLFAHAVCARVCLADKLNWTGVRPSPPSSRFICFIWPTHTKNFFKRDWIDRNRLGLIRCIEYRPGLNEDVNATSSHSLTKWAAPRITWFALNYSFCFLLSWPQREVKHVAATAWGGGWWWWWGGDPRGYTPAPTHKHTQRNPSL